MPSLLFFILSLSCSKSFSFIFGFFLSFLLEKYNKKMINKSFVIKLLIGFLLMLILDVIYFIGIYNISNGILHIYSMLNIILGMFTYKLIIKKIS